MVLSYGTDPEVFLTTVVDNKNCVISPALLEGTGQIIPIKDDYKHPVYIDEPEFSWMMDGVAMELTVKNPLKTPSEMYNIINNSLDCLENFISRLTWNGLKLYLYKKPVVDIEPHLYVNQLDNEKIYQGFIFGCDADEDAIDTEYECETIDVTTHLLRYGGGHFHISGVDELFNYPRPAIQLLAIFLGNYVVSKSLFPDLEKLRSLTYGRPGRFRQQEYKNGVKGIEYRTPSNSWLSLSLNDIEGMFYMSEKATNLLLNPEEGIKVIKEYLPETVTAIINTDQELASRILEMVC